MTNSTKKPDFDPKFKESFIKENPQIESLPEVETEQPQINESLKRQIIKAKKRGEELGESLNALGAQMQTLAGQSDGDYQQVAPLLGEMEILTKTKKELDDDWKRRIQELEQEMFSGTNEEITTLELLDPKKYIEDTLEKFQMNPTQKDEVELDSSLEELARLKDKYPESELVTEIIKTINTLELALIKKLKASKNEKTGLLPPKNKAIVERVIARNEILAEQEDNTSAENKIIFSYLLQGTDGLKSIKNKIAQAVNEKGIDPDSKTQAFAKIKKQLEILTNLTKYKGDLKLSPEQKKIAQQYIAMGKSALDRI